MTRKTWMATLAAGATGMVMFGGCASIIRIPLSFELPTGQDTFVITGGQPVQNQFTLTAADAPDISGGTMRLDPDAITFEAADTTDAKGTVAAQVVNTLTVTVWIGGADDIATVCGGGDEYGPFEVGVAEDGTIEEVSPSTVALRRTTVDLINSGSFTGCIRVESPTDATVTISKLDFTVSP